MATDFLIDTATGDLLIENGDLVIGDSDAQNVVDLVETEKAELKHEPLVGVGLRSSLKRRQGAELLLSETRKQLEVDGWVSRSVGYDDSKLIVDAQRPNDEN